MEGVSETGSPNQANPGRARRVTDPTLLWAIIVGATAAWIYVAPITFDQGALEALYRAEPLSGMVALTPYPQLFDDRVALYLSAMTTIAVAFIVGVPLIVRKLLTWWTVCALAAALLLGLCMIFLYVPRYPALWAICGLLCAVGSVLVAGSPRYLGPLAQRVPSVLQRRLAQIIGVLVALIELYVIIPASSGAYVATPDVNRRGEKAYLLLHMKDHTSLLHEEIVELLATTSDYLVVRLSDRVPHPELPWAPTTLPAENEPGTVRVGPFYLPILVSRDGVDIITPSLDPADIIEPLQTVLRQLPVTTQPTFKIGRQSGGFKVWAEYPSLATQPTTRTRPDEP
jgi:hypothetical protein